MQDKPVVQVPATASEPDEAFNPQKTLGLLNAIHTKLDEEVETGVDSHDLHDVIQDELLPALCRMELEIAALGALLMDHDARLAGVETGESQLTGEDAGRLADWIKKAAAALAGALTVDEKLLDEGKELIEWIASVTLEDDE